MPAFIDGCAHGRERFNYSFRGRTPIFLIALHVTIERKDLETDLKVAHGEGADGVFLIYDYEATPRPNDHDVLGAYHYARSQHPSWWIGINLLDHEPKQVVLKTPKHTSGLWFDDPRIDERLGMSIEYLAGVQKKNDAAHLPNIPLLFASIDFKGQHRPKDPAKVARMANGFADALVTSGSMTGVPADPERVQLLRDATTMPLGLASGVSVENVKRYLDVGVDFFIVNTSISTEHRLDPKKVAALRAVIPR